MNEMNAGIKNRAQGQERIHLLIKAPYVTGQGHQHHLSWAMNHERLYWCLFNALHTYSMEMLEWVSNLATFLFWLMSPSFSFPPSLSFSLQNGHICCSVAPCASSPIQRQMSDYFSFSHCPFVCLLSSSLSRLSVQFHPFRRSFYTKSSHVL